MTNELANLGLSDAGATFLGEMIAFIIPILTATFLALWRMAASRSKIQSTLIDAFVRGIEQGSERISDADTRIVKRAVRAEAAEAGVQKDLEQAVEKVKNENGKNGHSATG